MPAPVTTWMGATPEWLREQIQNDRSRHMRLRRATTLVSLLGIACMAATTLLQMGIVKRLPDPPVGNFDTKKVNSSHEAYSYGGPDSPINMLAHAVTMVLASSGSPERGLPRAPGGAARGAGEAERRCRAAPGPHRPKCSFTPWMKVRLG